MICRTTLGSFWHGSIIPSSWYKCLCVLLVFESSSKWTGHRTLQLLYDMYKTKPAKMVRPLPWLGYKRQWFLLCWQSSNGYLRCWGKPQPVRTSSPFSPQPRKEEKGWKQRTSCGYSLGLAPCTHHRDMQKHCKGTWQLYSDLNRYQVCMSHTHKIKINTSFKKRKLVFI